MTGRDLMPFGKYKKKPLSEVPKEYSNWLCDQEGFADKNPKLYAYFKNPLGAATDNEIKVIEQEGIILRDAPDAFISYWKRAYGERLRTQGEIQYIAMLRVALHTWRAALGIPEPIAKPATRPPPATNTDTPATDDIAF